MKSLATKLCRIYGEVSALEKEGDNKFGKYKYFTEGQMLQYLRPLLTREGIFIFHSVDEITHKEVSRGDKGKVELHSVVRSSHTFFDSETGESYTVKCVGEGIDSGDKSTYKAITGATKYFLMKTFGITDSQDPEADEKVDNVRSVTPTPFKKDVVKVEVVEQKVNDNFYRQSLLACLKSEGIPNEFVLNNIKEINWVDKSVQSLSDIPEGKAQKLVEGMPKIKERWIESQAVK
jgi:hypothetical protein